MGFNPYNKLQNYKYLAQSKSHPESKNHGGQKELKTATNNKCSHFYGTLGRCKVAEAEAVCFSRIKADSMSLQGERGGMKRKGGEEDCLDDEPKII